MYGTIYFLFFILHCYKFIFPVKWDITSLFLASYYFYASKHPPVVYHCSYWQDNNKWNRRCDKSTMSFILLDIKLMTGVIKLFSPPTEETVGLNVYFCLSDEVVDLFWFNNHRGMLPASAINCVPLISYSFLLFYVKFLCLVLWGVIIAGAGATASR